MIVLGLGSNLGDRAENICTSLNRLSNTDRVRILNVSSLYETEPVGFEEQPLFLNAVAQIETSLGPLDLLQLCLQTEYLMGRVRDRRWGPRIIDIDLLLYNDIIMQHEKLILPHPCLHERGFVLKPLAEIEPELILASGRTAQQMLYELADHKEVHVFQKLRIQGGAVQLG